MNSKTQEIAIELGGRRRTATLVISPAPDDERVTYSLIYRGEQLEVERTFAEDEMAQLRLSAQDLLRSVVRQELYRTLTREMRSRLKHLEIPASGIRVVCSEKQAPSALN